MANLKQWNEAIAGHFLSHSGEHPLSITEDIIKEIGSGIGINNNQVNNFLSSMLTNNTGYNNKRNHPQLIDSNTPEDIFRNGRKLWEWYSEDQKDGGLSWDYPNDTIPWLSHLTLILLGSAENKFGRSSNSRYPVIGDYIYHHLKHTTSEIKDDVVRKVQQEVLFFLGADKDIDSWFPGKKIWYYYQNTEHSSKSLWVFLHYWSRDNKNFKGKFIMARGYVQDSVPSHLLIRKDDREILLDILSSFDRLLPLDDRSLEGKIVNIGKSKWSKRIQSRWGHRTSDSKYILIEHLNYIWDAEDYEHKIQNTQGNKSNKSVKTLFLLTPYLFIDESSQYSYPIVFKSVRLHWLNGPKPEKGDTYNIKGKEFYFSNNTDYSDYVIINNDNEEVYFSSPDRLKVIKDGKQIGHSSTLRYLLDRNNPITITKDYDGGYGYYKDDKISGGYRFSIISRGKNRSGNLSLQIPRSKKDVKLTKEIKILPTDGNNSLGRQKYRTKISFEGGIKVRNNHYYYDGDESLPRARLMDGSPDNVEFFPGGLSNSMENMPEIREDRKGIFWTFSPEINWEQEKFSMVINWKYRGEERSATREREFTLVQDTYGMWQEHGIDDVLEEKELIEPNFSLNFKHSFLTHGNEEEIDEEQMQKTSIAMTESREQKESEKRQQRPRALMHKSEGEKKSEPLSKPKERNKERKKDKKKSSEKTDKPRSITIWTSYLKPVIQCASCGVPLATKGHVKFNCPECSTEIIGRCRRCRINSVPYKCKNIDCNFEGP